MTNKNNIVTGILVVLLVVAVGTAYYFYSRSVALADPQAVATREAIALAEEVGKLIVLPEGETPTIATVTDVDALKDQPFFANASLGDKVLLYSTARKAYLYNPSTKKLIEVAPLNIGEGATEE
jgi:hypothetical protein